MTANPQTLFGAPADAPSLVAAALGFALLLLPRSSANKLTARISAGAWLWLLAAAAALLSAGYVAYYLRGGPRSIDATSYLLEARGLASGHFAFPIPSPSGAFRGRFLLAPSENALAVIFPPGFPALLAPAAALGVPMLFGPCLAAGLVVVTHALGLQVSGDRTVARLAGAASVVCAALRYQTADTMSHGLCALLLATLLWAALRNTPRTAALAGLACGWLFATRPVTGIVGLLLMSWVLRKAPRRLALAGLMLLPGLLLLAWHQRAATGVWLEWSQLRYYALADGPPGCFDYGFGAATGCRVEHGDFVARYLPNGYGPSEALRTSWRRLVLHSMDIANFEPLALLVLLGAVQSRHLEKFRLLTLGSVLGIVAYAGFYFDGNYPGAGARIYGDILPFEHILLAYAACRIGLARWLVPSALIGFALHASFSHRALRDREGGRPMFEASVLERAGITHGLVFVDTDHGFNLGHDPRRSDAQHEVVVARYNGDAQDWLLFRNLGMPPTYHYAFDASDRQRAPSVALFEPASSARFEAEAQWPPRWLSGGWVELQRHPNPCGAQGIELHPQVESAEPVMTQLDVTPIAAGSYAIETTWAARPGATLDVTLASQTWSARAAGSSEESAKCQRLRSPTLALGPFPQQLQLGTTSSGVVIDALLLVDLGGGAGGAPGSP